MDLLFRFLTALGFNTTKLRWRYDRWKKGLANEARSLENRSRSVRYQHKVCPKCTHPAARDEKICTVCKEPLGSMAGNRARRLFASILPEGVPLYTIAIVVACASLYLVNLKASSEDAAGSTSPTTLALLRHGGMAASWVFELDHWWRLLTSVFLHGSVVHILFNMIGVVQLGTVFEQRWGRARFLGIFVVTGIAGMLVSALWKRHAQGAMFVPQNPYPIVVGASGAIFGLIGAGIASVIKRGSRGFQDSKQQLIGWAIYGLIIGFAVPGIDNAAHLGGLAAGVAIGMFVSDADSPRAWLGPKTALLLQLALLALIIAAFVLNQQQWPLLDDNTHFKPGVLR